MRNALILLPLMLSAAPATAQSSPQASPQIADPVVADRLANAVEALSTTLLDLRVGGVKAAIEGRDATPAERKLTVRDFARRNDPEFDQKVRRQIAEARPMMRQSIKTLNESIPALMQGLEQAQKSFERALANMPDPTYPKR